MSFYLNELKKGPPDLEEWFKKLGRTFAHQKKNPLQGSTDQKESSPWWWVVMAVILLAVVLVFSSVVTVKPNEKMVLTRFGAFAAVEGPGLHWTLPLIDQRTLVDVTTVQNISDQALLLTQDGSTVKVSVMLNEVIVDPHAYLFFGAVPILLQKQLAAATLQVMAKQNALALLSANSWPDLSAQIQAALPDLRPYGVEVRGVVVSNVSVPDALSPQFNKLILNAETQVQQMTERANQFAASIQPLAAQEAAQTLQGANVQQFAILVNAQKEAAAIQSLQPAYAVNPNVTIAYLPTLLAQNNLVSALLKGNQVMQSNQNTAYLRWQAANQAQAQEAADAENN